MAAKKKPPTPWKASWKLEEVSRKTSQAPRTVRWNVEKYPHLAELDEADAIHFLQLPPSDRRLTAAAYEHHAKREAGKASVRMSNIGPAAKSGKPKPPEKDSDEKTIGGFGVAIDLPCGFGEGMGLRVEVEKLKQAAAAARGDWADKIAVGHRDAPKAFAMWQQLLAAWTKLAKDAPAALTALDDSISREVHEKTIGATLQAVDRVLASLPGKISTAGQKLEQRKLQAICESEMEAARDALHSGRALMDEAELIKSIQGDNEE